jgi:hypothetical protein
VIAEAKRASAPAAASSAAPAATSAAASSSASASAPAPSSTAASQSFGLAALTPKVRGCVAHFTKAPRLVDLARYQGTPAYVIASASRVWVVGLSCTADRPHLIATAPLG